MHWKIKNCFFFPPIEIRLGRGVRGSNNGSNAESLRSPTTKTPGTLPAEPKTSVAVEIQPVV